MLEEKGVEFHLNAGVNEIVLEEGKVRGREGGRGGRGGSRRGKKQVWLHS